MKIFANALACTAGGARSVSLNFLRAVSKYHPDVSLHVVATEGAGYEDCISQNVQVEVVDTAWGTHFARPLFDRVMLPRRIREYDPDVVFGLGNFAVPTRYPQAVRFAWPYAMYPESPVWRRMSLSDRISRRIRRWAFGRSLRYADLVLPQTELAANRLRRLYPDIPAMEVVPNAVSIEEPGPREQVTRSWPEDERRNLLCLSYFYPHKNFEVFLPLAERIRDEDAPYRVITTVDRSQHPEAGEYIEEVSRRGLDDILFNIGPVPKSAVPSLYEATDGLLLPTLLESFSGTYVEAMYFRRPVFTSDLDFAHAICRDHAHYFDPLDADDILRAVHDAFQDPSKFHSRIEKAREYVMDMPDWEEVSNRYIRIFRRLAARG